MRSKIFFTPLVLTMLLSGIYSCDRAPKGDVAIITDKKEATESVGHTYVVDSALSKVRFVGYGVGKKHPGNFKVTMGTVAVKDNQITGGDFTIDVRSLKVEQRGAMFQEKLEPHLLSGDFFDANNFGTARFEITSVAPYKPNSKDTSIVDGANFNISGNLTIKGETKNITFPARVDLDDHTLKGRADFDIDRTQWKLNYGNDKTLGNSFISEKVNIELDLKANLIGTETVPK